MPGSRNLVIFLGVALVIARYFTSSQRSMITQLVSATSGIGTGSGNSSIPYVSTNTVTKTVAGQKVTHTVPTLTLGGTKYSGDFGGH